MIEISEKRFEDLVSQAIDLIPDDLFALIDNVVFLIEDRAAEDRAAEDRAAEDRAAEDCASEDRAEDDHAHEGDILGLYDGIPLTERSDYGIGELPDRIFIYRKAICAICETDEDVVHEVITTVVHEVAHHFGIDDERLHDLGWG